MRSDRATGGGRTPEHGLEGAVNVIMAGDSAAAELAADSQLRALNQRGAGSDAAAVRSPPSRVDPLDGGGGGGDGGSGMQSRAASPKPAADAARPAATSSALPSPAVSGRR